MSKKIKFKALAFASVLPIAYLVISCSSEEPNNTNVSFTNEQGFTYNNQSNSKKTIVGTNDISFEYEITNDISVSNVASYLSNNPGDIALFTEIVYRSISDAFENDKNDLSIKISSIENPISISLIDNELKNKYSVFHWTYKKVINELGGESSATQTINNLVRKHLSLITNSIFIDDAYINTHFKYDDIIIENKLAKYVGENDFFKEKGFLLSNKWNDIFELKMNNNNNYTSPSLQTNVEYFISVEDSILLDVKSAAYPSFIVSYKFENEYIQNTPLIAKSELLNNTIVDYQISGNNLEISNVNDIPFDTVNHKFDITDMSKIQKENLLYLVYSILSSNISITSIEGIDISDNSSISTYKGLNDSFIEVFKKVTKSKISDIYIKDKNAYNEIVEIIADLTGGNYYNAAWINENIIATNFRIIQTPTIGGQEFEVHYVGNDLSPLSMDIKDINTKEFITSIQLRKSGVSNASIGNRNKVELSAEISFDTKNKYGQRSFVEGIDIPVLTISI